MTAPLFLEQAEQGERDAFDGLRPMANGGPSSDRPLSTLAYVIAMLPRTGSTAYCSLLERTGRLGQPAEYLNPRGPLQHWARELDARHSLEYLDVVRRERSTRNGIFGLKTTYQDFLPLLRTANVTNLLGEVRFVYLTRRDLLAQAISEYIAEQSGLWHRDSEGRPLTSDPVKSPESVSFNADAVLEIVDRLIAMQQSWERFFVLYDIDPLRITYEDICADAGRAVADLAAFLDVPWDGSASLAQAATSKLADGRADAWAAQVRARFEL